MKKDDCIFCKIVSGECPSHKIFENEYVCAFLDISKDVFGHTLVIPKKHFENVFDCNEKYLQEVAKAIKKIAVHYKNLGFEGVNILNASGRVAEQSVFHLHFHILPKKNLDDFKSFPKLNGTDVSLDEQEKILKLN